MTSDAPAPARDSLQDRQIGVTAAVSPLDTSMDARLAAPHALAAPSPSPRSDEIAVIVPVYRGAAFVVELVERLHTTLRRIGSRYRIVLVDDRSPDDGWRLIRDAAAADPRVLGVRLSRNFGQHAAISAGLAHADAHWFVVMDCDLQDPPESIFDLYTHAQTSGAEVVLARRQSSALGARRKLGSMIFNSVLRWSSGLQVSSEIGNFRIFSHKVWRAYLSYPEQLRLLPALMAQVGFETTELILPRNTRPQGKSSYTFGKLARLALETMVAYSERPLWWMVGLGSILCAASVLFGLSIVIGAMVGGISVPGFATIACLVTFLGGAQLFLTSLVGLYVGRTLAETKQRPIFVVDLVTRSSEV